MLDTPCSEVVWRVLATHSIGQFPLHFPSRASLCAVTFQLDSTRKYSLFLIWKIQLPFISGTSLWRTDLLRQCCISHKCVLALCSVRGFLLQGYFFGYKMEVLMAQWSTVLLVSCFLLFPDNSNSDSVIILIQTLLTHWGWVTQICVFTLQLHKTDDANLRF